MAEAEPLYEVVHIRIDDLTPDPFQPRKTFKEEALQELASSIRQHGILQPLLVRPLLESGKYCIVAGERRYRASQLAGLRTLPCHIRPYLGPAAAVVALVENVHRADLNEMEKAESLARIKTLTDKTWEQVAEVVNLSTDYVKRLAGLLKLEETVKDWMRAGKLSTRVAIALRPLPPWQQIQLAERAIREGLTAEQIREEGRGSTGRTSRRAADLPPAPAAADGGAAGDEGKTLDTLREMAEAVERMEAWVGAQDWSAVGAEEQQRALRELCERVDGLRERLAAAREPSGRRRRGVDLPVEAVARTR